MRKTTHTTLGISCGMLISKWFLLNPLYAVGVSIFYSLLPDIDTGYSFINKYLIRVKFLRNRFSYLYYMIVSASFYFAYYLTEHKLYLVLSFLTFLLVIGKHRSYFHSLFIFIGQWFVLQLLNVPIHYQALALFSYFFHLVLDMFNPSGVMLFYPISKKVYRFPLTINSSSKLSNVVEWGLTILIIYFTVQFYFFKK